MTVCCSRCGNGRGFLYFCLFFDMAYSFLYLVFVSVKFMTADHGKVSGENYAMDDYHTKRRGEENLAIQTSKSVHGIVFVLTLIWFIVEIYLFVLLRRGLATEKYSDCLNWIALRLVVFLLGLGYCVIAIAVVTFINPHIFSYAFILEMSIHVYTLFELIVGYHYVKHLKVSQISTNQDRVLTTI